MSRNYNHFISLIIGLHKTTGVYVELRNIPPHLKSKLEHVYLVALINTQDTKCASFDIVLRSIVEELKFLETDGIRTDCGLTIKGALVNVAFDNLAGNAVFGFKEGFNTMFFCRICECNQDECRKFTSEIPSKLRNNASYLSFIDSIEGGVSQTTLTTGIKKYCLFNDLKYFSSVDNYSVDIMHDILEGVIDFFLNKMFSKLIENKIVSFSQIQAKVRDYAYGFISKAYTPSKISLTRSNLGQNAKQIHNLMIHCPFIFIEYRGKILAEWNAMLHLLTIMRIIFSSTIRDFDLIQFNQYVSKHLSYLVKSGCNLLPKHHFMTHYSTVIKKMGPLIHMWMMRMESKHKIFTDMARRTCNYTNLIKTFATQHQERLTVNKECFESKISKSSRGKNIVDSKDYDYKNYENFLDSHPIDNLFAYNFLWYNSYKYVPGAMIFHTKNCFEIVCIFENSKNEIILLCHPYTIGKFEKKLNSIEIKKDPSFENCQLIKNKDLYNIKTYERKYAFHRTFITADTLDVYDEY